MSVLTDRDIASLCVPEEGKIYTPESPFVPMIEPFVPHQVKTRKVDIVSPDNPHYTETVEQKILSWGLSSAGYDVRLDNHYKIFKNTRTQLIDPLNMKDDYFDDHVGEYCIIPPNGYILGLTKEWFNIPRDIIVISIGKSTLARIGAIANITPIEPGWKGRIVMEIANASNVPIKIHSDMGVAQFIFHRLSGSCGISYDDRGGKYQGQSNLQTALV